MKNIIEYRAATATLRAKSAKFELSGLAAAYNKLSGNLGGFRERIAPGAFTRALASGRDVICCLNHDSSKLLGRTKSGTLALQDSPEGLRFVCKLDPNQQAHRDLHSSVERGDIADCSFAFNVDGDGEDWDDAEDEKGVRYARRTLTNLKLHDVSVVTRPAYPDVTSVSARSSIIVPPIDQVLQAQLDRQFRHRLDEAGREIHAQLRAEGMEK